MKYCKSKTLTLSFLTVLGVAWVTMPSGSARPWRNRAPSAPELHTYIRPSNTLGQLQEIALGLANRDREQHGRSPLQYDALLSEAAQRHAEDMLRRNYFSHYSPEGSTPSDRFRAVGGRRGAGENIMMMGGVSTQVGANRLAYFQKAWMNSSGHRQNLLNPQYGRFGYGIASAGGRVYAVQLFSFQ